jgi:Protein of unknown function (DUF1592)/Protein of unknown function (DUF1588)/Protein of unknown function (DUF1587)/Protein of unknown function (DUF1585)/Protein of unknown function (DUF1595)/Planctomycete cytochrome C
MPLRTIIQIPVLLLLLCLPAWSADTELLKPFLKSHCIDCHNSETHEGGLNLQELAFQPTQRVNAMTWEKLFDRVTKGEMPPKSESQPPAEKKVAFLSELAQQLRAASLSTQQKEGRGPVRRLTRTEYENTVNDLLHIKCDLKGLFPEDAVTAGFDKVGEGLTLSATHFARYQEAAEKALAEAIVHAGGLRYSQDGLKFFQGNEKTFTTYGNWTEENNFVLTSQMFYPYTVIMGPRAPLGGKYRIRITAQARNNGGKPMPIAIGVHSRSTSKPDAPELSEWRDLSETEMRTVTMEVELQREEHINIFGPTLVNRDYVLPLGRKGERWTKHAILIQKVEIEGPLKADGALDEAPTQAYRELFDSLPRRSLAEITGVPVNKGEPNPSFPVSSQPKVDAERLIRRFLPKAFRRPVSEETAAPYVARVLTALDGGVHFHQAMLDGYKAILCSPHFLLHEETPGPLDAHALANRLAYFLWNGPPDETLLRADLTQASERRAQVERMLHHPKSARFEQSFLDQWLDLQKIDATSPDSALYPEFNPALQLSSLRETQFFFHELLHDNRSLLEGVQSDWTYLNEPLSWLYGLPEIQGHELRKVQLPSGSHRGGFLTQASILKVTADGAKTSPIIRGNWINEKILGIHPPSPPSDVAKIEPDIRGATTIREQLAKHRSTPACMSCHTVIDPPGFALETFDVIGGWRDYYRVPTHTGQIIELQPSKKRVHRGPAVEAGYTMPDGRAFANVTEYKTMLLEEKDVIAHALTEKLLTYATGARVQFADRDDLAEIVKSIRADNYRLRSLIQQIVNSRPFLNK